LDFRVELVKSGPQRPGQVIGLRQEGVPLGPKDAQMEFAVEERDFEAVGRGGIAMRLRDAMDDACQTETPQVISHLRARVGPPEERFDLSSEVAVSKSSGQMRETDDRLQERDDARVAESEGRGPLARFHGRGLEPVEGVFGQDALMTRALNFEELAIDLMTEIAQMGEISNPFVDVEIVRVVDRGLAA
jgi:hypothetical protein